MFTLVQQVETVWRFFIVSLLFFFHSFNPVLVHRKLSLFVKSLYAKLATFLSKSMNIICFVDDLILLLYLSRTLYFKGTRRR